jgi:hypothetical protein
VAKVNGRQYRLGQGVVMLIEHGDEHEIRNNGRTPLRTLISCSMRAWRSRASAGKLMCRLGPEGSRNTVNTARAPGLKSTSEGRRSFDAAK